ncbi:hypothetical protein KIKIMORA_04360 [Brevundimonas phage vB_BpoS-Kikimora]|uniref:Uncharacterized protein n=2 Tax=Kikimoravirus TaxID=3425051 RepID=A0A9E7N3P3_9CAUD|nr:hypothetical protein KIKIMORA_04360 [Brevundimonas phage vB_BpoS-Kikimora]UTC28440.1 hypothetical protein GURKE_04380 [Brevundimonas phage vB_BpoS-Gurke]
MSAHVTEHAELRARKRMGIPRKAVQRQAETALEQGAPPKAFSGSFRRYLDGLYLSERKATNIRVHGGNLYLFAGESLLTCWPVPQRYRSSKPRTTEPA